MEEQKESFSSQRPHSYRIFLSLLELSKIGRKTWRFPVSAIRCWNWQLLLPSQGPLLEPCGLEGGGLHFFGPSSCGKTTALKVAGSVCGGGGKHGYIRQWRLTDNALEGTAATHCDNLLCLDEIGQASSRVVSEVAYMLANGQGRLAPTRMETPRPYGNGGCPSCLRGS